MSSVSETPWLKDLQAIIGLQASILDAVVETLQQTQATLPEPGREEIQALREGRQPLSLPAFLRGNLQRVMVAVEDAACDLRSGADDEALSGAPDIRPTAAFINAIESSLGRPKSTS